MTTPNSTLRAIRMGMLLSQDEFAQALRVAGDRTGQPNDANKRLVQRWESGAIVAPRPLYARALEALTGMPIEALGFATPYARITGEGASGDDIPITATTIEPPRGASTRSAPHGNYSGVWLSRYEYYSSSRDSTYAGLHYVVVLQHGDRLTIRSLPASSSSSVTLDLSIDGNVLTGTWVEQTSPEGHYRGARYHGALQMLAEPTGRRIVGRWLGFGNDMEVNTGPWELVFQDASTGKATLDAYNHRPPVED